MRYENIRRGRFLARPNRFLAHVELDGEPVVCHVKNTGRCRELLIPGAAVYLQESANPARKTKFDLVAVEKAGPEGPRLINMDAQAPNKVFGEWAAAGGFLPKLSLLRPETTWGNSRFDFYYEAEGAGVPVGRRAGLEPAFAGDAVGGVQPRHGFVEVKGVTLEEGGAVYFPDAPTERGVKHVVELMAARAAGYGAHLCFVIQMEGARWFSPNDATHPAFGAAVRRAAEAGVDILALDCAVTPDSLAIRGPVEVKL